MEGYEFCSGGSIPIVLGCQRESRGCAPDKVVRYSDRAAVFSPDTHRPSPMSATRAHLLAILQAHPGLSQQAVAGRARVSERTARRHLRELVDDGSVLVTPDGTARRYRLADHAYAVAPAPMFTEG